MTSQALGVGRRGGSSVSGTSPVLCRLQLHWFGDIRIHWLCFVDVRTLQRKSQARKTDRAASRSKKGGHAQKLAAASGESPFKRKFHFIFYVSLWAADGREASQPAFWFGRPACQYTLKYFEIPDSNRLPDFVDLTVFLRKMGKDRYIVIFCLHEHKRHITGFKLKAFL